MLLIDSFIAELQYEAISTRQTLERVPDSLLDYRPHPKSMTARALASHIAEIPTWVTGTLQTSEMVLDGWAPFSGKTTADIVAHFDGGLAEALAAMKGVDNATLMAPWSLKADGKTLFTLPRIAVLRTWVLNHNVHHRAQLGLYLRLNNLPVPAVYGPTADGGTL